MLKLIRRVALGLALALALSAAGAAVAGPPFLSDDPQPTDQGHWEMSAVRSTPTADETDGYGRLAVNVAVTYRLVEHWSLLASAGPTTDGHGGAGQVFHLSLKADN